MPLISLALSGRSAARDSATCFFTSSTACTRVCLSFWLSASEIFASAIAFTLSSRPSVTAGLLPRQLLHLGRQLEELVLVADQLLDAGVRDGDRLDDVLLAHLEGAALDHEDRVGRAGDDELHVAVLELLEGRVEHPVALHAADADAGDGAGEGRLAGVQRVRRRDHRQHVGVVLLVGRDDVAEHLHFVLEALGEQRADGAVDDPAAQDLAVARPAFALDEAARNLAGGVGLLLVLDRQREERERALVVAHRDGREDHRVTVGDRGRSRRPAWPCGRSR